MAALSAARPALFLDRDGVINVEKNYLHRIEEFEFMEGIFDLCQKATRRGMAIVVVTNQAGIGRGYYTEQDFHTLTAWMCARFAAEGVTIDGVYFCPDHPEHGVGVYRRESNDRKPNPGMLNRACQELSLDPARSVMIGDKRSDIAAAHAAGVPFAILLSGVHGDDMPSEAALATPEMQISSIREAADWFDRAELAA
jgi:D-glycero-D-manno-heptose 1,7-bisphosphate phosphatase